MKLNGPTMRGKTTQPPHPAASFGFAQEQNAVLHIFNY